MSNLYAEREIIEQGDHYSKHVSAMTCEGLHSKSAIAAELAHRDIQLEQAQAEIKQLKQANFTKGDLAIEWKVKLDKAQARVAELEAKAMQVGIDYSQAHILRKQAEAVEDMWDKVNPDNPGRSLRDEAQRLRQQANELERQSEGGE